MSRIASMSVYVKGTDREVARGDILRTADGTEYRLVCADSPTIPGKSGKVLVENRAGELGVTRVLYAHIFGVYVAGWMDCGCPVGPDAGGHLDSCKEGNRKEAAWLRSAAAELTPGSAQALAYLAEADRIDPQ